MARSWKQLLPWVTAFTIAMAFVESAVVIYLRKLYYPNDFNFPLAPIDRYIAVTELLRELATMIMLLAPGALIARTRIERFAWFAFCFGVWDIFYYVFLKAILDWPASLFDWDVLFLVPVVWVGPVLAPCIVSVGLILLGSIILHKRSIHPAFTLKHSHWSAFTISGGIILYTFIEEPCRYLFKRTHITDQLTFADPDSPALMHLRDYIPEHYAWSLFALGLVIALATLVNLSRRKG